jgi:hypothetical protein
VEGFVFDLAEAFCEKVVECRTDYSVIREIQSRGLTTQSDCMRDYFNRHPLQTYSAAVLDGRSQFVSDNATACLTEVANATCEDIVGSFDSPRSVFSACQQTLSGQAGVGATCFADADCGLGATCRLGTSETCAGTCEVKILLAETCGPNGAIRCAANEYCDEEISACLALGGTGAPCEDDLECEDDHFCREGVCAPVRLGYQVGQPCNEFSNLCAMGLYCQAEIGDGVCAELASVGESCRLMSDCRFDASCDGVSCQAKVDEGTCESSVDCLSGVCLADSTCVGTALACVPPADPI